MLTGKNILITGGTGSFGKACAGIILKRYKPQRLIIFSRDELKQFEMEKQYPVSKYNCIRFFIGDVRDKERLHRAFHHVDFVIHAAALKHVPLCEFNPIEAVRTNIEGAMNIIDAAIDNSVEKVMVISTDKAVYPVNLYGATKMVAEKLFIQANSYVGERKTIFSCVRYGNVIASSGSVIPLFKGQKEKGEITITDEKMTRFLITLEQGIHFVVKSIESMKGGEIFIPKIPSMKIVDLAEVIAPGAKKKIIGIRPGEKLHEILLTREEAKHTSEFDEYFIIKPEFHFWKESNLDGGKVLAEGFEYTSKINDKWMTKEEMVEILRNIEIEK